jgi:enamine deaminase RidA (YjgF/YER057c/UK114 family)
MLKFDCTVLRKIVCVLLLASLASGLFAQRRKNKKDEDPPTQVLPPLPDPPDAVMVETAKLSFQTSPLSAKGLLSQQVRDALKYLAQNTRSASMAKLRAFVAGSGDLRRVQAIVSEEFSDRKQPLPAVSTIQVGALPMIGAQVVIEAISVEKRPVNPNGIVFLSGVPAQNPHAAAEQLKIRAAGSELLRITCFLSSLDDLPALRAALAPTFPSAATTFVQTQRQALEPLIACEAVGRLQRAQPAAMTKAAVVVTSPRIVLTGTKLVFRDQDSDVRLTMQRLGRSLEPFGSAWKDVFWTGVFSLTNPMNAKIEELRREFIDEQRPPAGTALLIEGVPSTDATAAVELMAAAR